MPESNEVVTERRLTAVEECYKSSLAMLNRVGDQLDTLTARLSEMPCASHTADLTAWAEFSKEHANRFQRHQETDSAHREDVQKQFTGIQFQINGMFWKILTACLTAVGVSISILAITLNIVGNK